MSRLRLQDRRRRRWFGVPAALGVAVAGALVFAPFGAVQAGAAVSESSIPTGFIPGEAFATADSFSLGIAAGGGKSLDVVLGRTIAQYQEQSATSSAAVLDLGLLGTFLGPQSACDGKPPILGPSQLPPVTSSNSERPVGLVPPLAVRAPQAGDALGAVIGQQSSAASPSPLRSSADVSSVSQDLGLIALDNPETSVSSQLVDGVREAVAISRGSQLRILGGLITIDQPEWRAVARTGKVDQLDGSFTFASAAMFGIPRSAGDFPGAFDGFSRGLSELLGGLGVRLEYPTVKVDGGRVVVSPMVLEVVNPPIGKDLLAPILTFLKDDKDAAVRELIAQDCLNQQVVQILDLVLTALSGTGSISLRFGGVEVFSAATDFPAPLEISPPTAPVPSPAVTSPSFASTPFASTQMNQSPLSNRSGQGSGLNSDSTGSVLSVPLAAEFGDVGTSSVAPLGGADQPTAVLGATQNVDDRAVAGVASGVPPANLVASRFEPGPSPGGAIAVGVGGLVVVLLLVGADRRAMSRTKRVIT